MTQLKLRQLHPDGAATNGTIRNDGTDWVANNLLLSQATGELGVNMTPLSMLDVQANGSVGNIVTFRNSTPTTRFNISVDGVIEQYLFSNASAAGYTLTTGASASTGFYSTSPSSLNDGYRAFKMQAFSPAASANIYAFEGILSSGTTGVIHSLLSAAGNTAKYTAKTTSSTNDGYFQTENGTALFSFGSDASDSGAFKISNSSSLGTTDRFRLTTGGQLRLPSYTTTSSFTGTQVGLLGFDSSGNIITLSPGGSGTVTSVAALTLGTSGTDLSSSVANGTTTPVITLNVPTASASNRGALSSTDWTTFNNKQGAITLTTTGTSGAATLIGNTLNIPNYATGSGDMVLASIQTVTGAKTFNDGKLILRNVANTFNGVFTNTNTADRTYTLQNNSGTLAFLSDITGTNSGVNTGDQTITLTGEATGSGTGSFAVTLTNSAVIGKVLTGYTSAAAVKVGLIYIPLVIPFAPPVWFICCAIAIPVLVAVPEVGAKVEY